jgi:hypothetical protein
VRILPIGADWRVVNDEEELITGSVVTSTEVLGSWIEEFFA